MSPARKVDSPLLAIAQHRQPVGQPNKSQTPFGSRAKFALFAKELDGGASFNFAAAAATRASTRSRFLCPELSANSPHSRLQLHIVSILYSDSSARRSNNICQLSRAPRRDERASWRAPAPTKPPSARRLRPISWPPRGCWRRECSQNHSTDGRRVIIGVELELGCARRRPNLSLNCADSLHKTSPIRNSLRARARRLAARS